MKTGHYSDKYLSKINALRAYQKYSCFRLAEPKKRRPKFSNLFIHRSKKVCKDRSATCPKFEPEEKNNHK